MADELRQQFTLDAAQALQTLDQLDQSFKRLTARLSTAPDSFARAVSINNAVNSLDGTLKALDRLLELTRTAIDATNGEIAALRR